MEIIECNLWDLYDRGEYIAITTNGFVKNDGKAVMGRGCAKECADKFPWFPEMLGDAIKTHDNIVHRFGRILTFPVKENWWEEADLDLIKWSFKHLIEEAMLLDSIVYLPKPGCGNGNLKWEDVEKILDSEDHRGYIKIVDFPQSSRECG